MFALSAFKNIKLIGIGILVIIATSYIAYNKYTINKLETSNKDLETRLTLKDIKLKKAQQTANENHELNVKLTEDYKLVLKDLQKAHSIELEKAKEITSIKSDIRNVKEEDDKLVSNVTIQTFDKLRLLQEPKEKDIK